MGGCLVSGLPGAWKGNCPQAPRLLGRRPNVGGVVPEHPHSQPTRRGTPPWAACSARAPKSILLGICPPTPGGSGTTGVPECTCSAPRRHRPGAAWSMCTLPHPETPSGHPLSVRAGQGFQPPRQVRRVPTGALSQPWGAEITQVHRAAMKPRTGLGALPPAMGEKVAPCSGQARGARAQRSRLGWGPSCGGGQGGPWLLLRGAGSSPGVRQAAPECPGHIQRCCWHAWGGCDKGPQSWWLKQPKFGSGEHTSEISVPGLKPPVRRAGLCAEALGGPLDSSTGQASWAPTPHLSLDSGQEGPPLASSAQPGAGPRSGLAGLLGECGLLQTPLGLDCHTYRGDSEGTQGTLRGG